MSLLKHRAFPAPTTRGDVGKRGGRATKCVGGKVGSGGGPAIRTDAWQAVSSALSSSRREIVDAGGDATPSIYFPRTLMRVIVDTVDQPPGRPTMERCPPVHCHRPAHARNNSYTAKRHHSNLAPAVARARRSQHEHVQPAVVCHPRPSSFPCSDRTDATLLRRALAGESDA